MVRQQEVAELRQEVEALQVEARSLNTTGQQDARPNVWLAVRAVAMFGGHLVHGHGAEDAEPRGKGLRHEAVDQVAAAGRARPVQVPRRHLRIAMRVTAGTGARPSDPSGAPPQQASHICEGLLRGATASAVSWRWSSRCCCAAWKSVRLSVSHSYLEGAAMQRHIWTVRGRQHRCAPACSGRRRGPAARRREPAPAAAPPGRPPPPPRHAARRTPGTPTAAPAHWRHVGASACAVAM